MKRKTLSLMIVCVLISTLFFGCDRQTIAQYNSNQKETYNGRVFYEIFVRAFNDGDGDGKGDLKGITQKLDYLSKDLGVSGIWLMPINASPSYHGYDVTDYYKVNSDYGTIEDFKELLKEAHKRNIKIIIDLVMNHTSKDHPWFKDAAANKESKYRDYYIWADKNTDVTEGSAISAEPWVKLGEDHYYALFWEGMPDLNFDNKAVREEMKKVAKFYLEMGVDGFRLDAAMHLYKETDKNLKWWKEFSDYVKSENKDAVLVGEVWDKTPTISQYMGTLDSNFNFPVGEAIIKMVSSGNAGNADFTITNSYEQYVAKTSSFIDSPFLTNHDQNRVMSALNDTEKAKKAASILLTLPGAPYIYYGEETGMTGKKPDERIREPFIWDDKDSSRNTSWINSTNDAQKVAVSLQINDKNSLLNHYKNLISVRNNSDTLKYGSFESVETNSSNIFAFKRTLKDKSVYVYINLGSEDLKEKLDINKARVLYSNKRNDKSISFKGELNLKSDETLILEK